MAIKKAVNMRKRLAAFFIGFSLVVCGTPAGVFASSDSMTPDLAWEAEENTSASSETSAPENESPAVYPADAQTGQTDEVSDAASGENSGETGAPETEVNESSATTEDGGSLLTCEAAGLAFGESCEETGAADIGVNESAAERKTGETAEDSGIGAETEEGDGMDAGIEPCGTEDGGSDGNNGGSEGAGTEGGGSGGNNGGSEGTGTEGGEPADGDDDEGISIEGGEICGLSDYYLYTGKYIRPEFTVTLNGETLTKNRDYAVLYGQNRAVGVGAVLAVGINDYCGILTAEFDIYSVLTLSSTCRKNGLQITWTAVDNSDTYTVYRQDGAGSFEQIGTTASCSFLDTGVASGCSYVYKVAGKRCESRDFTGTYLATPFISRLEGTNSGIKITWKAVEGATSYRVYAVREGVYVKLGDCSGTEFTDTGAVPGETCTYTVRARRPVMSDYDRTGTSLAFRACPTMLKAQNNASGCQIQWSAVDGAAGYRLSRREVGGKWEALTGTVNLRYTDTTAQAGCTYEYRVRCLSGNGWWLTGLSGTVTVTRILQPVLRKAVVTGGKVKITWKQAAGATKYRVYRKTEEGTFAKIADTADLFFVDTTVQTGQTYIYTVRAWKPSASLYDGNGLTAVV